MLRDSVSDPMSVPFFGLTYNLTAEWRVGRVSVDGGIAEEYLYSVSQSFAKSIIERTYVGVEFHKVFFLLRILM